MKPGAPRCRPYLISTRVAAAAMMHPHIPAFLQFFEDEQKTTNENAQDGNVLEDAAVPGRKSANPYSGGGARRA